MSAKEFTGQSNLDLLRIHARVIDELRRRDVLRSKNNPVGDYAEWLVATAFGWKLQAKSAAGYDAIDSLGVKYEIKARRITRDNASRQLGAIRNLEARAFDYVIGVLFDHDFNVLGAYRIPHDVVLESAKYQSHTNAHILHLQGSLLQHPRVDDLGGKLGGGASNG
jgi:hypothetical protein